MNRRGGGRKGSEGGQPHKCEYSRRGAAAPYRHMQQKRPEGAMQQVLHGGKGKERAREGSREGQERTLAHVSVIHQGASRALCLKGREEARGQGGPGSWHQLARPATWHHLARLVQVGVCLQKRLQRARPPRHVGSPVAPRCRGQRGASMLFNPACHHTHVCRLNHYKDCTCTKCCRHCRGKEAGGVQGRWGGARRSAVWGWQRPAGKLGGQESESQAVLLHS